MTNHEREENPTIENVLDDLRQFCVTWKNQKGETVIGIPGLGNCPWCRSEMTKSENSYKAVCNKNNKHVVCWMPWGG